MLSLSLSLSLLDTAREDKTSVSRVTDTREERLLGFGWVLDFNLRIVRHHQHTDSLEFLNGQEPSGACMPAAET